MDYFEILDLKKEPFSNSPEPEFFFESRQHLGCLQKLELAIRLRRGLNVVIGDVGTGKTTLCRQILLKFATADDDKKQIETHLVLDPSFSTPLEFLLMVANTFGIPGADANNSEWQLKENIKNYLFKKGVHEGKIVILIIDEGQKLPDFCLEILREFLNYETNEYKLLQIVIFAQKEFEQIIQAHANFADRINQYYFLKPLDFKETRGMIQFRLAKTSNANTAPSLFSYFGLCAVHHTTGGYPRKIISLCHQVILALIIQNRSKAGWFLVRSCANRGVPHQAKKMRWATATALVALFFVVITVALASERVRMVYNTLFAQKSSDLKIARQVAPPLPAVSPKPADNQIRDMSLPKPVEKVSYDTSTVTKKIPDRLGRLIIKKGGTLWWIFSDIYGAFNPGRFKSFTLANPHITNINFLKVGEVVNLPALPVMLNPLPSGAYWVQITSKQNIEEAYRLYKDYPHHLSAIRLFPYWNGQEGMVYAIFLKDGFTNEASAMSAIQKLPSQFASSAKVVKKWESDTVFFANL